jgi:hypothetical protein
MPVITRNQRKHMTYAKPISKPFTSVEKQPVILSNILQNIIEQEQSFINNIEKLLCDCDEAKEKTAKITISLKIFDKVNNELENLLSSNSQKWLKFAATVYNKTTEFESQRNTFKEVNSELVDKFTEAYLKARNFLCLYFTNLRASKSNLINLTESPFVEMYANIDQKHFKVAKFSRPRRNVPRVDYTGMDMTEEDEGTISVCEVKWTDRVPTYKWVKYPASKANELDHDEWYEEN